MLRSTVFEVRSWGLAVLIAVGALVTSAAGPPVAGPSAPATDTAHQGTPVAVAEPAAWTFAIYDFRDPYAGDIQQPEIPGTRVVGAEVEVVNRSTQSLTLHLSNMRLHTDSDLTYPAGLVIGHPEDGDQLSPKLVEGVVEGGDTARGWVWWRVPEGAKLVDVRFFPSPPAPDVIPLPLERSATVATAEPAADATAMPTASARERGGPLAVAAPPSWTFGVYRFEDPYAGDIQQPEIPGTRVVGAEVEVINRSNQSLTLYLNNLRLRTGNDVTHPAGIIIGNPEGQNRLTPKLVERVVEAGDSVRGWVWWRVPADAELLEVDFFPAPPPPSIIPLPVRPRTAAPVAGTQGVSPQSAVMAIVALALLAAVAWVAFRRRQNTAQ